MRDRSEVKTDVLARLGHYVYDGHGAPTKRCEQCIYIYVGSKRRRENLRILGLTGLPARRRLSRGLGHTYGNKAGIMRATFNDVSVRLGRARRSTGGQTS